VMPNMNMQIAETISPVRRFFRARRLVIMGGAFYRCTSATIAQKSRAR
jgi:hypothetical protein